MKKVYQDVIEKNSGNCMQAAIASLLELKLEEVPNFKIIKENWFTVMFNFLDKHGYEYIGCLNNQKDTDAGEDSFKRLCKYDGIKGLFFAAVYSPGFYNEADEKPITHAVIIDDNFNIVHDVNPNNKDVKKYPLADKLGYNGVIYVYLIRKKSVNYEFKNRV